MNAYFQKLFNKIGVPGMRNRGYTTTINSETVRVYETDIDDDILLATGTAASTTQDAQTGYAKGGKYIDTDVATGIDSVYVNVGTSTASVFVPVGSRKVGSAVTATADGLTTGLIPASATHVTVTSASADNIATLPAAVVGMEISLYVGANGCEVRTPATSGATINGVDSDGTNEAAIPATSLCTFTCVAADTWILEAVTELGAVITAIVPDAA